MTRKLENLDSGTLDRISGGCRPVVVDANPGLSMRNKLRGIGDTLFSNQPTMTTLPASLDDLRDVAGSTSYGDLRDVAPPAIHDLVPALIDTQRVGVGQVIDDMMIDAQDDTAGVVADDDDGINVLDELFDMQGAGADDGINTLPPMWCGTGSTGSWDECDDDVEQPQAEGAGVDADADADTDSAWEPTMGTVIEIDQPIAPPTVRDHRPVVIAEAADVGLSEPLIRDHRSDVVSDTGTNGFQGVTRDQR